MHQTPGSEPRRHARPPPPLLLLLLVLLATSAEAGKARLDAPGAAAAAATVPDQEPPAVLIVEYMPDAVTSAMSAAAVSTAASKAAGAAAAAAAAERGASAVRRQAVAAIAAEAAEATAAVAALTSRVTIAAIGSGVNITGLTNYATVLRGAAIKTGSHADARALKAQLQDNPAVRAVWFSGTKALIEPVKRKAHASGSAADASLVGSTAVTGVARLRKAFPGVDGSGVLLCVVDTGISLSQPLYGQCSAVNYPKRQCQVVSGYNFVGDGYVGTRQGPAAVAGGLPADCMGHGSMVASVAGTQHGIAPGVVLGSYRVFGCSGYAGDNVLVEAIDRAVRDGCDVINLSLASGSGYEDNDMYKRVMASAVSKGVLVVKAAGNSGSDGPFRADVATAVGAITVASVDVTGSKVSMSPFSSFGPNPSLDLLPHVSAPGGEVPVIDMHGEADAASGTSFASPYTAGVLALWLQHKQQAVAAAGRTLDPATITQDAALRGLVATAKGVRDRHNPKFLEPVAWMGAGVLQAAEFIANQLSISPMSLQLPSALAGRHPVTFSVAWEGAPAPSRYVTYRLSHEPAAAITLSDGWYGTKAAIKKTYAAASVSFPEPEVTIDTSDARPLAVDAIFSLPAELAGQQLLYSGVIRLTPVGAAAGATPNGQQQQQQQQGPPAAAGSSSGGGVPAVGLPYQGYAAPMAAMRLAARPASSLNAEAAAALRARSNALCYSPGAVPAFYNEVMDHLATVPDVCTGGLASGPDSLLKVSLAVLRRSPECSLRVTMAAEVPLKQMTVLLLDDAGRELGAFETLDTTAGGGLAKTGQVMSYCTRFDGSFRDVDGQLTMVSPGQVYRLRVVVQGPISSLDAAHGLEPRVDQININGRFLVTSGAAQEPQQRPPQQKEQPGSRSARGQQHRGTVRAHAQAHDDEAVAAALESEEATVSAAGISGLLQSLSEALP